MKLPERPWSVFRASIWGMSFPWTLCVASLLGIWLMFAPTVFGTEKTAANLDHLVGALTVTVSVICMGEVVRIGRDPNVLLGLAAILATWFISGGTLTSHLNDTVAGAVIIGFVDPPRRYPRTLWLVGQVCPVSDFRGTSPYSPPGESASQGRRGSPAAERNSAQPLFLALLRAFKRGIIPIPRSRVGL